MFILDIHKFCWALISAAALLLFFVWVAWKGWRWNLHWIPISDESCSRLCQVMQNQSGQQILPGYQDIDRDLWTEWFWTYDPQFSNLRNVFEQIFACAPWDSTILFDLLENSGKGSKVCQGTLPEVCEHKNAPEILSLEIFPVDLGCLELWDLTFPRYDTISTKVLNSKETTKTLLCLVRKSLFMCFCCSHLFTSGESFGAMTTCFLTKRKGRSNWAVRQSVCLFFWSILYP